MNDQEKVLVLAKRDEPEFARLKGVPHVLSYDSSAAARGEVTAILHWSGTRAILRDAFAGCRNLRWIHSRFAGVDGLLFPELVSSGVVLTNGKGVYSAALGEFALAAILYFAKEIPRLRRDQAAEKWAPFEMERIAGQTVGIVGYGDIGRAAATRAHAMGMRILATKRHPAQEADPLIERFFLPAELRAMLALCDYVVVAAPLTPETRHMIGDAEFGAMKSTAVLINVGRGPVIDTDAMVRALNSKRIRGAGLDVVDPEPLPAGHALYGMDNVLLSPHCADMVRGWTEDAMRFFLEQYARFRNNQPLLNVVNKGLGY
ncbi:MAG TPA: D-2-hydroxyacid dehydrogenase [Silvibacterium sp.]|nr:D-2-hydroxyacid dehydrogenase [Silvibacterium sp.]